MRIWRTKRHLHSLDFVNSKPFWCWKIIAQKRIIAAAATATATAAALWKEKDLTQLSYHTRIHCFAYNTANDSSQPLLINNSIHRGIAWHIIMAITTIVDKWLFAYLSVSLLSIQVCIYFVLHWLPIISWNFSFKTPFRPDNTFFLGKLIFKWIRTSLLD